MEKSTYVFNFFLVIIDENRYEHLLQCEEKLMKLSSKNIGNKTGYGASTAEENEKKVLQLQNLHALETPVPGLMKNKVNPKELQLIKKQDMQDAVRLLGILEKEKNFDWKPNGTLVIETEIIPQSNFFQLFPLTFSGLRESKLPGEEKYFSELKKLGLTHFIRSVKNTKCRPWYYIGDNERF